MLDPVQSNSAIHQTAQPKPVFRMIRDANDRIDGSMPAWVAPATAQAATVSALASAGDKSSFSGELKNTLSLQESNSKTGGGDDKPFGFGDLLDIINPLQHIPIVSSIYRSITGDEQRGSSEIIGGAIYGGFFGAAAGIADAIVRQETGKGISEHAMALFSGGGDSDPTMIASAAPASTPAAAAPSDKIATVPAPPSPPPAPVELALATHTTSSTPFDRDRDDPVRRLAAQANHDASPSQTDLPGSMLSFVDLGNSPQPAKALPAHAEKYAAIYHFNE